MNQNVDENEEYEQTNKTIKQSNEETSILNESLLAKESNQIKIELEEKEKETNLKPFNSAG